MREKVLITGGSGLIGAATARRLSRQYDVVGLDTKPPRRWTEGVEHVDLDISSPESIAAALERVRASGERVASVIHLAAYYDFSGEPSPKYDDVTVGGTEHLVKALQQHLTAEQVVFSSSMLVHAPCAPGERISEDWPIEPKWDYPRSKAETEQVLLDHHGAVPVAILRIAGVYDDRCHSIPIAHQLQRVYERQLLSHVFPGDTSRGQAFVHLDCVVDAFARLVERRRTLPAEVTMLIGEPETMSYEELQRAIGQLIHGEEWHTTRVPKPVAKAGAWLQDQLPAGEEPFIKPWMIDLADDHYALDITRARALLGWEPRRSLRATLPIMVAALKADPLAWYRENKLEPPGWLERQEGAPRPEGSPSPA